MKKCLFVKTHILFVGRAVYTVSTYKLFVVTDVGNLVLHRQSD